MRLHIRSGGSRARAPGLLVLLIALSLAAAGSAAAQDWRATERIETYPVSGASGIALYRSIGENGPRVGAGSVIAYTTFDLKWSRDYVPENGGCTLKRARPFLTIIYRWPRATGEMPPATQRLWERFIAGIEKHERVHGEIILDMVREIEAFSVGLRAEDDPNCRKVREVLQRRLGELSQEQRARSRAFDREELSEGGNVHQLVLGLVNG